MPHPPAQSYRSPTDRKVAMLLEKRLAIGGRLEFLAAREHVVERFDHCGADTTADEREYGDRPSEGKSDSESDPGLLLAENCTF